ncbi:MAG TPA: DinB family protein [Pedobacter sp.]|nr:DinB family protein [Pedobacter sp.]
METALEKLLEISEEDLSEKTDPGKWSKKEIIGHLIDSATNNHHRFVRGQFEKNVQISYDQNKWNVAGHYQDIDSIQLIQFWMMYNRQLIELWRNIPKEKLSNTIYTGDETPLTLGFLIQDYVVHLEHHLKQLHVLK